MRDERAEQGNAGLVATAVGAGGVKGTRALLLLAGLGSAAAAQPLPTRFDVTGVGSGDTLNVRAGPGTGAAVVGSLAPGTRGVEVVATSGGWGQVNLGEAAGWVSMRYLTPQAEVWTPGALPSALACLGTEPFWSLRPDGAALVYGTPDDGEARLTPVEVFDTGIPDDPRRMVVAGGAELRLTAAMVPVACSDGMSDRAYGLEVLLLLDRDGAKRLYTGCCSVDDRG